MRTATYLPRLLMAVVTAALSVAATAPPAVAHAELSSSSPAGGATVQELPRKVTLTFTESVRTPAFVAVTGMPCRCAYSINSRLDRSDHSRQGAMILTFGSSAR